MTLLDTSALCFTNTSSWHSWSPRRSSNPSELEKNGVSSEVSPASREHLLPVHPGAHVFIMCCINGSQEAFLAPATEGNTGEGFRGLLMSECHLNAVLLLLLPVPHQPGSTTLPGLASGRVWLACSATGQVHVHGPTRIRDVLLSALGRTGPRVDPSFSLNCNPKREKAFLPEVSP